MNLGWVENVLVTGIVTFLHQVKAELIAGTLNKQSVKTDAVNSAEVSVVTAVDSLETLAAADSASSTVSTAVSAASSTPQAAPITNNVSNPFPLPPTPLKTPSNGYSGGDSIAQV